MAKTQKYILKIADLDNCLKTYASSHPQVSCTLTHSNSLWIIELKHVGSNIRYGVLRIFKLNRGPYFTIQIQGRERELLQDFRKYVLNAIEDAVPPVQPYVSFKMVDAATIEKIMTELVSKYHCSVSSSSAKTASKLVDVYKILGDDGATCSTTYYGTKTLLIQGTPSRTLARVVTQCISTLMPINLVVNDASTTGQPLFDENLSAYIHNMSPLNSTLQAWILSSIKLVNSGIAVSDYSFFCGGALRTLEALMGEKIAPLVHIPPRHRFVLGINFEVDSTVTSTIDVYKTSICNPFHTDGVVGPALARAYTFYHATRNELFHPDLPNSTTSRCLTSLDDARDLLNNILLEINELCNHL